MKIKSVSALLLSICLLLLSTGQASAKNDSKNDKKNEPLRLAISGTVIGGGTFSGTLALQRFVSAGDAVMATGFVTGSITGPTGEPVRTVMAGPVDLPVEVGAGILAASGAAGDVVAQQQVCSILHLELGSVTLDLLGLQVMTTPIGLDLSAEGGGTNVLGELICTILETVGNVIGLVDLLNDLLGLLTGLAG